jgi:PAS domain S-box-containing protein
MNSQPAPARKNDKDKGKVELLSELERLRARCARQQEIIALYADKGPPDEKAAIKSERDFRAIVTKNADAMVVLDGDGRVLYVNPAAETLFCMPAREMAGKMFGFPIVPREPIEMYVLREYKAFVAVEMRLVEVTWDDKPAYLISLRDMTDRIKAEHALSLAKSELEKVHLESEERYKVISGTAFEGIVIHEAGRIVELNEAFARMFGYKMSELIGKRLLELAAPESRDMVIEQIARQSDEPYEITALRKDGSTFLAETWGGNATYDGKPVRVGSVRDITGRKRAEEELRNTRDYLESLINYANAPIIVWDPMFTITLFNHAFERLTGYVEAEVMGKSLRVLFPGDSREESLDNIKRTLAGEHWESVEIPILRKDGSIRIALWNSANIYGENGSLRATIAQGQDITERRLAEESLRASEARYRELVESANSIIIRTDRNGDVTFINGFGQRFLGYSEDEIIGKNALGTIIPESDSDGRDLEAMLDDLLRHPEEYRTNVHENMRKSGELVWVSWTNKAIYDDRGNMVGLLSIGNDITRLKRAERELQDSKAQAELYLDLMGHDINNMHQIALGYLELAREMIQADESQLEYLDKPIEVLQRSARLISNVRKMQKLLEGYYRTRTMDVRDVLADVHNAYGAIPYKPVTLDYNGNERCHVRANDLLYDVFANLVTNAIKHTGDRANISVKLERVEKNGKGYCRVSVDDDGPGIPDDFKSVVFNRMLKGTANAKGMGMGLYLVKSLVDSYGGRVWVEDRVKGDYAKGAKFVVMLPTIE